MVRSHSRRLNHTGETIRVPASSTLESKGDDVTIYVPDDLAATIDARIERTNGEYYIHSDFPMELTIRGGKASAIVKLGGGGDKIRLRARGGEIHIWRR